MNLNGCASSRKNGLHETSRTLEREISSKSTSTAHCKLVELIDAANYSPGRILSSTRKPSPDERSVETRIVSYNPAKKDPYGSATFPIYQTATFAQPSATEFGDYDYTRSGNPTRDAAQNILAEVDNGCAAYCFSTGMAAIMVVTRFAESGQNIILSDDSYGGTYRLLAQVCSKQGVPVKYVDMSGEDGPRNLAAAMSSNTALVMCESPTNPLMRV